MNSPETIVQRLASESSTTAKIDILGEALREENKDFFAGVRLAYDKSISFGVSTKTPKLGSGSGLDFADFVSAVQPLMERATTGDAAIEVLRSLARRSTPDQWLFWYRRIVMKNLDCGITSTSIHKMLLKYGTVQNGLDYAVPTFGCQLATDIDNVSASKKEKLGMVLVQPKLDGVRVLARVAKSGGVTLFSRSGHVFANFPKIERDLSECFAVVPEVFKHPNNDIRNDVVWFDGEIVSDNFRTTMMKVNRKDNTQTDDCTFTIFDFIPDAEFKLGEWDTPCVARTGVIGAWLAGVENLKDLSVKCISSETLDFKNDPAELQAIVRRHLKEGYEGTMVKDAYAPYVSKRNTSWLKIKPTISITMEVIDSVEGEGKYVESLGALICEGVYEGKKIRVSVGGGFSDSQRREFWANREKLVHQLIEVEADSVSQSASGEYSLRFPRMAFFRGFECLQQL